MTQRKTGIEHYHASEAYLDSLTPAQLQRAANAAFLMMSPEGVFIEGHARVPYAQNLHREPLEADPLKACLNLFAAIGVIARDGKRLPQDEKSKTHLMVLGAPITATMIADYLERRPNGLYSPTPGKPVQAKHVVGAADLINLRMLSIAPEVVFYFSAAQVKALHKLMDQEVFGNLYLTK